jgi:hypothetical protein
MPDLSPSACAAMRDRLTARDSFYSGVNSALAFVAQADQETLWREIVAGCGGDKVLRAYSRRNGNLRIDGFARYKPAEPAHGD